jgi:phosphoribosylformimino-5-aminoimidazole carboxamide ribotide isomerase
VARHWAQQGAEWLYVVNLDGPLGATTAHLQVLRRPATILIKRPGAEKAEAPATDLLRQLPINLQQLRAIRQAVTTPIQFGGGLRTLDDIELALELGADRVVLGTIAAENPELVELAIEQWGGDRIVVSIEAHNGKVQVQGRKSVMEVDAIDIGYRMRALGVKRVLYRDLDADETTGVNVDASAHLGDITDLHVIACGKIVNLDELARLKAHEHYNIEGVVVNQALYADKLALPAAIALGHQPLRRRSAGIIPYRYHDERIEFLLLTSISMNSFC